MNVVMCWKTIATIPWASNRLSGMVWHSGVFRSGSSRPCMLRWRHDCPVVWDGAVPGPLWIGLCPAHREAVQHSDPCSGRVGTRNATRAARARQRL
ncbi:MAG: hypothetical protein CL927_08980 [Deltaproteobacteria bacterium]|nr:hypothetical protein [Deltaproteobacteria bacterium]HCH65285.1 hypothetical protein [Deltaproteobacteria bacterium]